MILWIYLLLKKQRSINEMGYFKDQLYVWFQKVEEEQIWPVQRNVHLNSISNTRAQLFA